MDTASLPAFLAGILARLSLAEAIGYAGIALTVATSAARTMIPLRCLGIATNAVFLVYGLVLGIGPTIAVNALLLPLNAARLVQMLRLVREVRRSSAGDLSMDWLKPFMSPRTVHAGEVLFAKGDWAECLFYTLEGRFRLKESGIEIGLGELVGEIAFLAPDRRRTQTLECIEAGAILTVSYDELMQLYHQNPAFGFYFLSLTSSRLLENIATMEGEVERLRGGPAAAPAPSAAVRAPRVVEAGRPALA